MRQFRTAVAVLVLLTATCRYVPLSRALVTYRVTGTAASAFMVINGHDRRIEEVGSVPIPWSVDFVVAQSFDAYLLAYNETAAGSITATILFDGIIAAEQVSAAPFGLVNVRATVLIED